ncbi:MAG: histidine triad nucleotide-binding protein [Patescibacteria group bacterium]|jgi:histidine triad (HIT) family protein
MSTQDCIFCSISDHEAPATVVWENEDAMAFQDIHPRAKVHVLLIPKRHYTSLANLNATDAPWLGKLLAAVPEVAEKLGIRESGFKTLIQTGVDGGQVVGHLHIHILGGERVGE